jgi:hypothetical protein
MPKYLFRSKSLFLTLHPRPRSQSFVTLIIFSENPFLLTWRLPVGLDYDTTEVWLRSYPVEGLKIDR